MTETELYDGVIMEGTGDLFFVANALQRHGGMAVNACVAPFYTADCDLAVVAAAGLAPVLADLRAADWRIKEMGEEDVS